MAESTAAAEPANPPLTEIVVIVAHPELEQSRANRRLMRAALALQKAAPERIQVRDLYALYPDYVIDAAAEQACLAAARLVVWQQPIHWYGMTPLLKLWVDDVLTFNWAYGPGGTALRGKDLWLVASTGGPADSYRPDSYNRYFFDAFMPPYEQTAALCGMRFLPPMLVHGAHKASEAEIAAFADSYTTSLERYPDWPEIEAVDDCVDCQVPQAARPQAAPVEAG